MNRITLDRRHELLIASGVIGAVILSWAAVLLATFVFEASLATRLVLALVAAVGTEVALWVLGGLLGITLFQKLRARMRPRPSQDA